MSQDNIKSAVYRSLKKSRLVPYEDSNETDTYGTNRKYMTSSQMAKPMTIERRMTDKFPLPSLICKEEKKSNASIGISELHWVPSSRLREVSQEAQRLSQMVESLPKRLDFNQRSSDIANDLLRGASDLQESLIMLKNLQEASGFMARMKRKQKPNIGKEEEEIYVEKMGSNRFQNDYYQNLWQTPEVSVDGSSRKRREELKKVIRDSLHRQNLLPVSSGKEKDSSCQLNFNSLSDGSLASSSRSLTVPLNDAYKNFCNDRRPNVDNSSSSTSQHKAKSPNLIAKLMGLDDFASETGQTTKKQLESKKCLYTHRPNFDIDMPKTRKLQFTDHNADPEKKTLKEIIDTMQFKGLLKSNYSNDLEIQPHLLNTSRLEKQSRNFYKERSEEKLPPIVIIKPLHFPCLEREEIEPANVIQTEEVSDPRQIHKRLGGKDQRIKETIVQDTGILDSKEISEKSGAREPKIKEAIVHEDAVSDSKQIRKKLGTKEHKIVETADESSNKIKASVSLASKQKKKEAIKTCKKGDEVLKALPDRRKPVKEITKSVTASRSQVRTTSSMSKNPVKGSIPVKNHSTCQASASQNHNFTRSTQPMSRNSMTRVRRSQTKKEKKDRESPAMNSVDLLQTDNAHSKDDKGTVPTLETYCISNTERTLFDDQIHTQARQEEMKIEDCSQENPNSTTNVVLGPTQCAVNIKCAKEANKLEEDEATISNTIETGMGLKKLLLSSPSFLSCAEELYDLNKNQPMFFQTSGIEAGMGNTRLLLDCANELMTHKSCRRECMSHPFLWTSMWGPKFSISMDQLVEELINGIENLRCYCKIGESVLPKDGLYMMLERDLRCKGMLVNGVWDMGWVNGFSMEDVEQVVGEVEKHVLSGLIEEAITDLL